MTAGCSSVLYCRGNFYIWRLLHWGPKHCKLIVVCAALLGFETPPGRSEEESALLAHFLKKWTWRGHDAFVSLHMLTILTYEGDIREIFVVSQIPKHRTAIILEVIPLHTKFVWHFREDWLRFFKIFMTKVRLLSSSSPRTTSESGRITDCRRSDKQLPRLPAVVIWYQCELIMIILMMMINVISIIILTIMIMTIRCLRNWLSNFGPEYE